MSTIDLVKAAQDRSYIKFEDMALEALRAKVQENSKMQSLLGELNVAQNISEKDLIEAGTSKEDLMKEYGKSKAEVDEAWSKAAGLAKADGKDSNFGYIISIIRGMLK